MLFYIMNYIKEYYNNYDLNPDILNIKNNLKKTYTLKKKFYKPTFNEINNKLFMINLKKKYKINHEELILIKNNLRK